MSVFNDRFDQANLLRRFGNITTTSTSDVLVAARTYNEQGSEGQRSVKSTSASDGSSKKVRIVYLTSAYELKTEDVVLNGTTAVDTVATDIRFIEDFVLAQGAAAVGAIELFPNTGGTGTAITGIGVGTTEAFLCHHYVPAGFQAWIVHWGVTTTGEVNMKLLGQNRIDGTNLVDRVIDLENILTRRLITDTAITARMERDLGAALMPEKTRCRIHVVPATTGSTVTRAQMYLWEQAL